MAYRWTSVLWAKARRGLLVVGVALALAVNPGSARMAQAVTCTNPAGEVSAWTQITNQITQIGSLGSIVTMLTSVYDFLNGSFTDMWEGTKAMFDAENMAKYMELKTLVTILEDTDTRRTSDMILSNEAQTVAQHLMPRKPTMACPTRMLLRALYDGTNSSETARLTQSAMNRFRGPYANTNGPQYTALLNQIECGGVPGSKQGTVEEGYPPECIHQTSDPNDVRGHTSSDIGALFGNFPYFERLDEKQETVNGKKVTFGVIQTTNAARRKAMEGWADSYNLCSVVAPGAIPNLAMYKEDPAQETVWKSCSPMLTKAINSCLDVMADRSRYNRDIDSQKARFKAAVKGCEAVRAQGINMPSDIRCEDGPSPRELRQIIIKACASNEAGISVVAGGGKDKDVQKSSDACANLMMQVQGIEEAIDAKLERALALLYKVRECFPSTQKSGQPKN